MQRKPYRTVVQPGEYRLIWLADALPDTEVPIYYTGLLDVRAAEDSWIELYPKGATDDANPLRLTAVNSPIVLNLPGSYRIMCDTLDQGVIGVSDPYKLAAGGPEGIR